MKSLDTHIYEIDILRFFAVLGVIFFHFTFLSGDFPILGEFSRYGYLGVRLFFMISGFVILMNAENRKASHFVVSRAVRLYPTFWLCCLLTYICVLATGDDSTSVDFKFLIVNLSMLASFFDVKSMDSSYWSLYVELNFYLLVSIMLFLKRSQRLEKALIGWLAISAFSFYFPINSNLETFLRPNFAPYFIAGGIFYMIYSKGASIARTFTLLGAFLVTELYSIRELDRMTTDFGLTFSRAVGFVTIATFFAAFSFITWRKKQLFKGRKYYYLGLLTYPLYLLHQRIGYLAFKYYKWENNILFLLVLLTVFFVVALTITTYFELPVSKFIKSRINGQKQS